MAKLTGPNQKIKELIELRKASLDTDVSNFVLNALDMKQASEGSLKTKLSTFPGLREKVFNNLTKNKKNGKTV